MKKSAVLLIVVIGFGLFGLGIFLGPTIMSSFNRQKDLKATLSPDGQQLANLYQNLNGLKVDLAKFEKQKEAKQKELANQQKIIKFATELTSSTKVSQPISIGSTDYTLQQIKEDVKARQEQSQKLSQEISQKNKYLSDFKKIEAITAQLAEHSRSNLQIAGQEEEIKKAELAALLSDPQIQRAVSKKRGSLQSRLDTANQAFSQKLNQPLLSADISALTSLIDWNSQTTIPTEHWLAEMKIVEEKKLAFAKPAPMASLAPMAALPSYRPAPRQTPAPAFASAPAKPAAPLPFIKSTVDSDTVLANADDWTSSKLISYLGDVIEFGPFSNSDDADRLLVRQAGKPYTDIEPMSIGQRQFVGRVTMFGKENFNHYPMQVKLNSGHPLHVQIRRVYTN